MIDVVSPSKILIIRMLSGGDIAAIGLSALRFFKHKFPDAELHFLTYGQGKSIIELAEPQVSVKTLNLWPDDFFQAMEAFLGLAEQIIAEGYQQIVNLDTAFMPCFLNRFLQEAGEPVSGNYLSVSIENLLNQVRDQSLQADYVNVTAAYMVSSFFTMNRWHNNWWETPYLPDGGYPEFYLKQCCGFSSLEMDYAIPLPNLDNQPSGAVKKTVCLCFSQSEDGYLYPHGELLRKALEARNIQVVLENETNQSAVALLKTLQGSALMVAKPSAVKWLADAVNCPTLLISGACEPRVFMPDYATDTTLPCPVHSGMNNELGFFKQQCTCDDPQELADNIVSLLTDVIEDSSNA